MDGDEDADKDHECDEQSGVLDEDDPERELDLHVLVESFVEEVEQLLRLKGVVFLNLPQIFWLVEITLAL